MLVILGALIAAGIGFATYYLMWRIQVAYDKSKVAQGFYLEISSLEKTIKLYATAFGSPPPGGAGPVRIDQPFYSDGLFFTFRKEIFGFNRDLLKILLEFYNCLLEADRCRQIVPPSPFSGPANDAMKSKIMEAYTLLPKLKELLKKEFHS